MCMCTCVCYIISVLNSLYMQVIYTKCTGGACHAKLDPGHSVLYVISAVSELILDGRTSEARANSH